MNFPTSYAARRFVNYDSYEIFDQNQPERTILTITRPVLDTLSADMVIEGVYKDMSKKQRRSMLALIRSLRFK